MKRCCEPKHEKQMNSTVCPQSDAVDEPFSVLNDAVDNKTMPLGKRRIWRANKKGATELSGLYPRTKNATELSGLVPRKKSATELSGLVLVPQVAFFFTIFGNPDTMSTVCPQNRSVSTVCPQNDAVDEPFSV